MPSVKIVQTERPNARQFMEKALEFCAAARQQLDMERYDAALLLAVHAGISGADAACIGLGGRRSADPDHLRAADLLAATGRNAPAFVEQANKLRALIGQKNRVEYEDKRATVKDARDAVARCERLVTWAREELIKARLVGAAL